MQGLSQWQPQGRFKRIAWEFEVEVVDEEALRGHDLHAINDEEGNFIGVVDMDDNERVQWALSFLFTRAMQTAESTIGVKLLGGGLPMVRLLDADGYYRADPLPRLPPRGDDGEYLLEWPPPAATEE